LLTFLIVQANGALVLGLPLAISLVEPLLALTGKMRGEWVLAILTIPSRVLL
jgi:hypothetical protein